jgi:eukaryotic-like serine/threonine-protein kinase
MALVPGTKIGSYEVLSPLGAGGMGEVYRARDTKLSRDVALKVLPEAFGRDGDRMARFQREAKVLASLNHPHIASIYGLEDSAEVHGLVMELVEGPTLSERIRSGAIPIDECLPIAKQITEALEYAHERGIVHRDLKPANVKLAGNEVVKVLDFGLAKAIEGDAVYTDISTSPTLSRTATMAGVLLGTAAYMSPEQAKGKPVDRRADIWAFGCVSYEMLTGKRAFDGETITDTLAAVVRAEPDWSQLPSATPTRVRELLQRCLKKDAKQRLQAIGDARIVLEEALSGAPQSPSEAMQRIKPGQLWFAWGVAAVLFVSLAPIALFRGRDKPAAPGARVRFQISAPEKVNVVRGSPFAISPDGRQLAFYASGLDRVQRLWIRALDSLEARPLSGSESPGYAPLFWSPDSRYIAFYDAGTLKKIGMSGGDAEPVCNLTGVAVGGSWNRDGVIIFGSNGGGLMRVAADGGRASPLTTLDASRNEIYHAFPSFLPDGRHFVYERVSSLPGNSGVFIGSLDAKPEEQVSKRLLAIDFWLAYGASSDPGSGQLVYTRDGALKTQPFDARKLELAGEPTTLDENRDVTLFSVSDDGVLVYWIGGYRSSQLTWIDRRGKVLGTPGEPSDNLTLAISPDGTRSAVSRFGDHGPGLWVFDFERGTNTRFTLDSSNSLDASWSPDGKRIIFASNRDGGTMNLYQKLVDGAKNEELLLKSSEDKNPTSWSRDGRFLLFSARDPKTKADLWVLPLEGDKKPKPFLQTEFNEQDGHFSPDGRWIAYTSDESGRNEIYVRTFAPGSGGATDSGGKTLISTGGGVGPRWREDGKELFYLAPDGKVMAVEITNNPVFRPGVPKELFQGPAQSLTPGGSQWDVAPNGERFLIAALSVQSAPAPFTVVLNWQTTLKQ